MSTLREEVQRRMGLVWWTQDFVGMLGLVKKAAWGILVIYLFIYLSIFYFYFFYFCDEWKVAKKRDLNDVKKALKLYDLYVVRYVYIDMAQNELNDLNGWMISKPLPNSFFLLHSPKTLNPEKTSDKWQRNKIIVLPSWELSHIPSWPALLSRWFWKRTSQRWDIRLFPGRYLDVPGS